MVRLKHGGERAGEGTGPWQPRKGRPVGLKVWAAPTVPSSARGPDNTPRSQERGEISPVGQEHPKSRKRSQGSLNQQLGGGKTCSQRLLGVPQPPVLPSWRPASEPTQPLGCAQTSVGLTASRADTTRCHRECEMHPHPRLCTCSL